MKRGGLSRAKALALRPAELPAVEVGLRRPPRRPVSGWLDRQGRALAADSCEILASYHAVKGWVTRVSTREEHEGPDYTVSVAYTREGALEQRALRFGFDRYHWAVGGDDHLSWWQHTVLPGGALTLLVRPGDRDDAADGREPLVVFGNLMAYRRRRGRLFWAADRGAPSAVAPEVFRVQTLARRARPDDLVEINNEIVHANRNARWEIAAACGDAAAHVADRDPLIHWATACAYVHVGRLADAARAAARAVARRPALAPRMRADLELAPLRGRADCPWMT